jgi:hypothetical protein
VAISKEDDTQLLSLARNRVDESEGVSPPVSQAENTV